MGRRVRVLTYRSSLSQSGSTNFCRMRPSDHGDSCFKEFHFADKKCGPRFMLPVVMEESEEGLGRSTGCAAVSLVRWDAISNFDLGVMRPPEMVSRIASMVEERQEWLRMKAARGTILE
eukprot:GFYU01011604.1.p1 GENE.GFYU01011604.1~~GFYU01011604.1.p1  ORF type:complete len:119 (-),score=7.45 GFYU01011604.1:214-570(-)